VYLIDPTGSAYTDLNITLGPGIPGILYGDDPCAHAKPWKWWAPSTWRNVHPYVGPALGVGASVHYAPDIPDPVSGRVHPQTPTAGWYRQGNFGLAFDVSFGDRLNPALPWVEAVTDSSGTLPGFVEFGGGAGLGVSVPYVW